MLNKVFLTFPSLQILGKNKMGVCSSDFWISGESFVKENCHNSRTSDDIDIKFVTATKLDKGNKTRSKNDDDVMTRNCDVIVMFLISGQFGSIWKPDSRRTLCETYNFIDSDLLSYQN